MRYAAIAVNTAALVLASMFFCKPGAIGLIGSFGAGLVGGVALLIAEKIGREG